MRVKRVFDFEAAHRLPGHPGKCRELHGHSYRLVVTVDRPVDPADTISIKALRNEEQKPTEADVITCLRALGHEVDRLAVYDNVRDMFDRISSFGPDVVAYPLGSLLRAGAAVVCGSDWPVSSWDPAYIREAARDPTRGHEAGMAC